MSKTAEDVKGIRSANDRPVIVPVETDMENKHLSKAQFVKKYELEKKANAAANAARQAVLDKAKGKHVDEPNLPHNDEKESAIKKLRDELVSIEKQLEKDPTSKKLLKQKNKIAEALDKAENSE